MNPHRPRLGRDSLPAGNSRAVMAILLLGAGFLAGAATRSLGPPSAPGEAQRQEEAVPVGDVTSAESAIIAVFDRASPSVVYVTSLAARRDFLGRNVTEIPRGTGSGFVWDDRGHIVTNFHVIREADAVHVTFADQSMWRAEVVGTAPGKDLAVLRVEAPREQLRPLPIGDAEPRVGQAALAIGNPFGLDHTLTTGVISALGREIESVTHIPIRDVIQTDAAINPGNSGGPLLDSQGRLIGVSTAIYSPSGAYAGIGFAIPATVVRWVVPDLIAYGEVRRPSMGVQLAGARLEQRLGLAGALVLAVVPGGAAERAGLRGTTRDRSGSIELGDLIVAVDGAQVRSSSDLVLLLERRSAGEAVSLTVLRRTEREVVEVTLETAR